MARGLFKSFGVSAFPKPFVVADNKARAFGKQIATDVSALILIQSMNSHDTETEQEGKVLTYPSSGHSSQFRCGKILIRLRGECSRKMHLTATVTGQVLKSLWSLGPGGCDRTAIMSATNNFTKPSRYEMRQLAYFIPAWLSDKLFYS